MKCCVWVDSYWNANNMDALRRGTGRSGVRSSNMHRRRGERDLRVVCLDDIWDLQRDILFDRELIGSCVALVKQYTKKSSDEGAKLVKLTSSMRSVSTTG